jgi:hypothetical protein
VAVALGIDDHFIGIAIDRDEALDFVNLLPLLRLPRSHPGLQRRIDLFERRASLN